MPTGQQRVLSNCVHRDSNVFCLNVCIETARRSVLMCALRQQHVLSKHVHTGQECVLSKRVHTRQQRVLSKRVNRDSHVFCLIMCIKIAMCSV